MITKDNIDIQRMHDVIEGKLYDRRCGKTTTQLFQVALIADLLKDHTDTIVVVNKSLGMTLYAINAFQDVLECLGFTNIKYYPTRHMFELGNMKVEFKGWDSMDNWFIGRRFSHMAIDHSVDIRDDDPRYTMLITNTSKIEFI